MRNRSFVTFVSLLQGGYYFITGLWPIFSRRTFEQVTGPKADFWLVRTIGGLIAVIGGVLATAGLRRQTQPEVAVLGIGSAVALGASDTIYAVRGRISPVYLLEAVVELGLIVFWAAALLFSRQGR